MAKATRPPVIALNEVIMFDIVFREAVAVKYASQIIIHGRTLTKNLNTMKTLNLEEEQKMTHKLWRPAFVAGLSASTKKDLLEGVL